MLASFVDENFDISKLPSLSNGVFDSLEEDERSVFLNVLLPSVEFGSRDSVPV